MRLRILGLLLVILLPMNLFAQEVTPAPVADTAAHVADTTTFGVDTDPRAGTTPVADTEPDAGQRIGVWSFVIVSGRAEGRGNSH